MKATIETIDREAAERYLNLERGNNRPFSPMHLVDLIGRQQRDEWVTNGDSIRFDVNGQLRDGQHRLRMVKQTGIPIEVIVVRDIVPEAFKTMDVGKKRSLGDVLFIEHETNHAQLGYALGFIWRYLSRKMTGKVGSYEEHFKVLHAHPGIRDSVSFYLNLARPLSTPGWSAITTSSHYLFSQVEATEANDFIEKYVTGLGLVEATDPIKVLHEQVVKYASAPRRPSAAQIFALIVRAWNACKAGQSVKQKYPLPKENLKTSQKITGFPKELFLESQLPFLEDEED
ncbi:hypothetical protein ES703_109718 [subsurface metagenome]